VSAGPCTAADTSELCHIVRRLKDETNPFGDLSDPELEQLAAHLERRHLDKGTVFFKEGEQGDYLGIIMSGRLEVKKKTEFADNQILLAVLSKGSVIGELAMVDNQPRAATVRALDDAELFILRRGQFDAFVEENTAAGLKIFRSISRLLSVRLRMAVERFSEVF
jgi:CRP-like cAMP-binding protein